MVLRVMQVWYPPYVVKQKHIAGLTVLREVLQLLDVSFVAQGVGFRVWGLGFRVWGLGFRIWDSGLRV